MRLYLDLAVSVALTLVLSPVLVILTVIGAAYQTKSVVFQTSSKSLPESCLYVSKDRSTFSQIA